MGIMIVDPRSAYARAALERPSNYTKFESLYVCIGGKSETFQQKAFIQNS